jgi:hypothetical protein
LQRYTGIVAALGGLLTLLHVAVDWLKYKR